MLKSAHGEHVAELKLTTLDAWIRTLPVWLQHVADDYCQGLAEIGDETLASYKERAIKEARGEAIEAPSAIPLGHLMKPIASEAFGLTEISKVVGVNRIQSEHPLSLVGSGLNIIYGHNGTGKTGFVKMLAYATRNSTAFRLLPDVYARGWPEATCTIATNKDSYDWSINSGPIPDLESVQIYNEETASQFRVDEYSLAYEPPVLKVFEFMAKACAQLRTSLNSEIEARPSTLPLFPEEFRGTQAQRFWAALGTETRAEQIAANLRWSADDERALDDLTAEILAYGTEAHIRGIRNRKSLAESLKARLLDQSGQVSDSNATEITRLEKEADELEGLAKKHSASLFTQSRLEGLGTTEWMQLWESARAYSEKRAYVGRPYPQIGEKDICVLCQQPLSGESGKRLKALEEFVQSDLQARATKARITLSQLLPTVSRWLTLEELKVQVLQLFDADIVLADTQMCDVYLRKRAAMMRDTGERKEISKFEPPALLGRLDTTLSALTHRLNDLSKPEASEAKAKLSVEKRELEARKWAAGQLEAGKSEVRRKKAVSALAAAKRLCDTTDISNEKKRLAESLAIKEVRERFAEEVKFLCHKTVPVTLKYPRGDRGTVLTKVVLEGTKHGAEPFEVLSEGEQRAISLAAFLSDRTSIGNAAPFVFDDPVSSFDHRYEYRLAERLVALSRERQVIVFSHRLTFVHALEEIAKKDGRKDGIDLKEIYLTTGGGKCGLPTSDWPFKEDALEGRVKRLKNETLSKLRNAESGDDLEAKREAQERACAQLRECVEQTVEYKLCAGVVTRFAKEIRTKNRLARLSVVTIEDCRLMDDLMTRYSYDVHLQSDECPYVPPELSQIEKDIVSLSEWIDHFAERCKKAESISTLGVVEAPGIGITS